MSKKIIPKQEVFSTLKFDVHFNKKIPEGKDLPKCEGTHFCVITEDNSSYFYPFLLYDLMYTDSLIDDIKEMIKYAKKHKLILTGEILGVRIPLKDGEPIAVNEKKIKTKITISKNELKMTDYDFQIGSSK